MTLKRDDLRTLSLATVRTGLVDALTRALALFSILLNFTLPFGVALAGPTDETGTALCLSGYGASADTSPFSPVGAPDSDANGLATDGDCLLCITCHAPSMAGIGMPPPVYHNPVESGVVKASVAIDIQAPRGGEGAKRVRAPPATL